eukprot:4332847-Pyramimonas_sp.AAC.1
MEENEEEQEEDEQDENEETKGAYTSKVYGRVKTAAKHDLSPAKLSEARKEAHAAASAAWNKYA